MSNKELTTEEIKECGWNPTESPNYYLNKDRSAKLEIIDGVITIEHLSGFKIKTFLKYIESPMDLRKIMIQLGIID